MHACNAYYITKRFRLTLKFKTRFYIIYEEISYQKSRALYNVFFELFLMDQGLNSQKLHKYQYNDKSSSYNCSRRKIYKINFKIKKNTMMEK